MYVCRIIIIIITITIYFALSRLRGVGVMFASPFNQQLIVVVSLAMVLAYFTSRRPSELNRQPLLRVK